MGTTVVIDSAAV